MFSQAVALAPSPSKLSGAPSWSSMWQEEDMAVEKGAGGGGGGSRGGISGWPKGGGRWLVGVGESGVGAQGMERMAEKSWVRVWVASSSSGNGRGRLGSS